MPDQAPRPAFGNGSACLHCVVWDAINALSPKDGQGRPMYSATEIISNLSEVVAEIIASHPRSIRRQLLGRLDLELREVVAKKVATGDHPNGRPPAGVLN